MSQKKKRNLTATSIGLALLLGIGILVAGGPLSSRDSLTLRVNDAEAEPGGLAAVVIRTYSSRPLARGRSAFGRRFWPQRPRGA